MREYVPKYLGMIQTSSDAEGMDGSLSALACVGFSVVVAGANESSASAATVGVFAGVNELNAWLNASSKSSKDDGSSVKMMKERNDIRMKEGKRQWGEWHAGLKQPKKSINNFPRAR